jgi:mitogen-activated protein kinase kinase kinase
MLASVLGGEILKGEKSRIGGERPVHESFKKELGAAYWWQIRARLRGRTEEEERRRTKERRDRTVDAILEEVERFKVQPPLLEDDDEKRDGIQAVESEQVQDQIAMEQILAILSKLSLAESLYPNTKTFRAEKPLYDSPTFQARVDALASWSTVVHMLQNQVAVLQKWTGSKELDITKPNTTAERALVGKSRYHPLDSKGRDKADQAADDSTFIERVLKEDSLRSTFNKRAMLDMYQLVYTAKQTVIDYRDIFVELGLELGLAGYRNEIVMLIAFPARLIVEALRVRLDAASKLVDPSALVIDDMIANFRTSLELACQVKQQYLQIVEPDPDAKWDVPHCLGEEYDQIIVDALRMFFKLLHWKLKSGGKEIYFRETDILNGEWDFLNEVATCVEGGDVVVAEHYRCVGPLRLVFGAFLLTSRFIQLIDKQAHDKSDQLL